MEFKKICVLGLGYIGLPTASTFATHGVQVVGVDVGHPPRVADDLCVVAQTGQSNRAAGPRQWTPEQGVIGRPGGSGGQTQSSPNCG